MTREFKAGEWENLHPLPSPPDPARAAAERAVIEAAMGWADGRNGGTALAEATTALRALDTPPDPVEELIAALRRNPTGYSSEVGRAISAVVATRKAPV